MFIRPQSGSNFGALCRRFDPEDKDVFGREIDFIVTFLAIGVTALAAFPAAAQEAPSSAALKMMPNALSISNEQANNALYFPSKALLSETKPDGITASASYEGTPQYGVISLGDGPKTRHAFAIVAPSGGDAKFYFDLNGDGDLSKPVTFSKNSDGWYEGCVMFRVSYGTDKKESGHSDYGINFVWNPAHGYVTFHRAGELTGSIKLDGKTYGVKVIENDNDARFNKSYKDEQQHRPLWIEFDGTQCDGRGTFGIADMNYRAALSSDGTRLTMEPTADAVSSDMEKRSVSHVALNGPAPDFIAFCNGKEIALSDLRDRVVVLDMWATWCGPCQASLPHVQAVSEKYKDKGVVVLALCVMDDKAKFDQWVAAHKEYTLPFVYDQEGNYDKVSGISSQYGVSAIPNSFVIDKKGNIAAEVVGFMGKDDARLEAAIDKALAAK